MARRPGWSRIRRDRRVSSVGGRTASIVNVMATIRFRCRAGRAALFASRRAHPV